MLKFVEDVVYLALAESEKSQPAFVQFVFHADAPRRFCANASGLNNVRWLVEWHGDIRSGPVDCFIESLGFAVGVIQFLLCV
jgi:hypothetical protein